MKLYQEIINYVYDHLFNFVYNYH